MLFSWWNMVDWTAAVLPGLQVRHQHARGGVREDAQGPGHARGEAPEVRVRAGDDELGAAAGPAGEKHHLGGVRALAPVGILKIP